jgi:hypothetical protein
MSAQGQFHALDGNCQRCYMSAMNPFGAWIEQAGLTKHAVADAWGVQDTAVWKITRDGYKPSRDVLIRIWRFTGGAVTPDAMLLSGEKPPEHSFERRLAVRTIQKQKQKEKTNAKRKKGFKSRAEASRAAAE